MLARGHDEHDKNVRVTENIPINEVKDDKMSYNQEDFNSPGRKFSNPKLHENKRNDQLEIIMEDEEKFVNNNAGKVEKNFVVFDKNSNLGKDTETNSLATDQQLAFRYKSNIDKKSKLFRINLDNTDKKEEIELEKIQIEFRDN